MTGYNSVVAFGTLSPSGTAGAPVVTTGALQAGRYVVNCVTSIQGAAIATDLNNLYMLNGSGTVSRLTQGTQIASVASQTHLPVTLTVASGNAVSVVTIGTTSVNATYTGRLVLDPEALY